MSHCLYIVISRSESEYLAARWQFTSQIQSILSTKLDPQNGDRDEGSGCLTSRENYMYLLVYMGTMNQIRLLNPHSTSKL